MIYPIAEGTSVFSDGLPRAMAHFGKETLEIGRSYNMARGFPIHWQTTVTQALHWALDSRDPAPSSHDHMSFNSMPQLAEYFGVAGGEKISNLPANNSYKGAESTVAFCVKHQMLKNSLPWCEWQSLPHVFFRPPEMDIRMMECRAFSAVTGIDTNPDELWRTGERIWNLQRSVMVMREGRTRRDDTVEDYQFENQGKAAGPFPPELDLEAYDALKVMGPLNRNAFDELKDEYYTLAGWNIKTGRPEKDTLEALGLKDVADVLESSDKII